MNETKRKGALMAQVLALSDQILVSATSYFTTVLVGRVSKEELGIYGFGVPVVLAIISMQEALLGVSLVALLNRRGDPKKFLGNTLVCEAVLASAFLLVCTLAGILGPLMGFFEREQGWVLTTIGLSLPFFLFRMLVRRAFFASLRVMHAVVLDASASLIQAFLLLSVFYFEWLHGWSAHLIVGISSIVPLFIWWALSRSELQFDFSNLKSHFREIWHFARSFFASQILFVLHLSIVLWAIPLVFRGQEGIRLASDFLAALSTMLLANPIVLGVINLLGPRAARGYEAGGNASLRKVVFSSTILMAVFAALLWLMLVLFADAFLGVVFGSQYRGQEALIAVLGASMFFETICKSPEQGLIAIERPLLITQINALRLVVTIVALAVLLPLYGLLGAACSLGIADGIAALLLMFAFVKATNDPSVRVTIKDPLEGVAS